MKFELKMLINDPEITTKFDLISGRREFRVTGRDVMDTPQIRADGEKIIEVEQFIERLTGVRVHLSQVS